MNQFGKICRAAALRRPLNVVLCLALPIVVMGIQAQAQSVLTRHVHQEVMSGEAAFLNRLLPNQSLRLNLALPLRNIVPPVIPSN